MPDNVTGFARALPIELTFEGGKVDDPADPGGRTNKGITQATYDRFRARKGMQRRDVFVITDDEVQEIYHDQYWNLIKGDQLPPGVDLVVMDGAVNSGPAQSIKWLQAALDVPADGLIGPTTLHAVNAAQDYDALIARIIAKREAFLRTLSTFKHFGKGWLNRTLQVEQIGQAIATGSVGADNPQPVYTENMHAKANVDDVKHAPPKGLADAATGGGIGSIGLSQVVGSLQEQLTPYSYSSQAVANIVIGLIAVGAVLTIAGIGWRLWSLYKSGRINEAQI